MPKKSIKTLENEFKSTAVLEQNILELKKKNKALEETVSKLLSELEKTKDIKKNQVIKLELSPEETIIEMQILRLQEESMTRALTYDETRMLDIHIKNKRLLGEKSTINAEYKALPVDASTDELMRLAEGAESKEKSQIKKSRRSKSKTSS